MKLACKSVQVGSKIVQTPSFLCSTRKGAVPHLMPYMVKSAEIIVNFDQLIDVYEKLWSEDETVEEVVKKARLDNFALKELVNSGEKTTVLQCLTPQAIGKVNDKYVCGQTEAGMKKVSLSHYATVIRNLKPTVAVGLSDLASGSENRMRKAVRRNLAWLDELLSETEMSSSLWASVVGGESIACRLNSLQESLKRPVKGVVLEGTLNADLVKSMNLMDLTIPCYYSASSIQQILEFIPLGINLFDTKFAICLTFQIDKQMER